MRGLSSAINAVLYSDQVVAENAKVDARLLDLMQGRGRRVGYVPSGPEPGQKFFLEKRDYYARLGVDLLSFADLDITGGRGDAAALFACAAIHLPGSISTVGFRRRLQRIGLLEPLRDWAASGGLLAGTSAGAMLMAPTVALDVLFTGQKPEDIADEAAMDLVPFEYFPHIDTNPAWMDTVISYSRQNGRPVAVCRDGDGIVVNDGKVECLGNVIWLDGGAMVSSPFPA